MVLKNYETVFILTPLLNEAQVAETVEKFRQVLKENGADIIHEENWGLKNWLTQFRRNLRVSTCSWNLLPQLPL
jgi:ribosomal protein S6